MAETTNLEVVTPSAIIVSEPVEMVVIPGSDGQIGALPRHSKVISTLDRGLIDIFNDNKISSLPNFVCSDRIPSLFPVEPKVVKI